MKEFNTKLFIKKFTNLERLIISAEKSIESNNPKSYILLLSYYKEIILLNLNYCQVKQILLKVLELNQKILKDNIKDFDCFIAFSQFFALTYDFAEDYIERMRITYLFVYNYESAKLLKPNDYNLILDYCNGLNKFKTLLFSDNDFSNECNFVHFEKIPEIRRYIYKILYQNYSFAEKSGSFDAKNYINYLKTGYYYFNYFNYNKFPKRLIEKSIMIFENYIFPDENIIKLNPDLNEIFDKIINLMWESEYSNRTNLSKRIYSLFILFKNSSMNTNGHTYQEFMKSFVYSTIGSKKQEQWKESFLFAQDVLTTAKNYVTEKRDFEAIYQYYYYLHLYHLKSLNNKEHLLFSLFKTIDMLKEAKQYDDKYFTRLNNNIDFLIDFVKNADEKEIIKKGGEWVCDNLKQ